MMTPSVGDSVIIHELPDLTMSTSMSACDLIQSPSSDSVTCSPAAGSVPWVRYQEGLCKVKKSKLTMEVGGWGESRCHSEKNYWKIVPIPVGVVGLYHVYSVCIYIVRSSYLL